MEQENNLSEEEFKEIEKKADKENTKTLRKLFLGILIFISILILIVFFVRSINSFEYRGLKFKTEKYGELIIYQTSFPVYSQKVSTLTGKAIKDKYVADYNIYIRNNPTKLEKIPFDGEIVLLKNMVVNTEEEFNCNGDGIIAIANLAELFRVINTKVITDPNATCDSEGRYIYLNILAGNESKIGKYGPACYNLYINNCEILKVTEKYIVETLIKINEQP